jgi:WS/DGAT/MGAT family acyltransferase
VAGQAARDVRALPGLARGATGLLRRLARPQRAARDAYGYAQSLRRVLADPDAPGSPLLKGRSMSWRYLALDVEFADLRAASKSAGATLNDAYLAALLAALRLYHEQLGTPVEAVPIAIPISVRRQDDAAGGNQFTGARLAGPVAITDPIARMRAIGERVKRARSEPAINGIGFIAPVLARLPSAAVSDFVGSLTATNDLQASNVPGIREDVYLAGAKIERMYGFGPLPGCACMVTLVTHGSTCCVGVNVDPAAVTDIDRFVGCLRAGFEEVLALGGAVASVELRI